MGIKYNALTIDFIDNKTASEFSTCDVLVISNDEKYVDKKLLVKHNMGLWLDKR